MHENDRLAVFRAQTRNVRSLSQVRTHLTRSINYGLRKGDSAAVAVHTRCLALVFCAWVEANFSKLIHTPYGFALDEIEQIKRKNGRARSVESAWQKAVQLGLLRIEDPPRSNYLPNRRQEIIRLIDTHVVEPSLIRNKIAHGQWQIALNRDNTAVNTGLTSRIRDLDIVTLDRWFETQGYLALIVESLIESPNRTFQRDYWPYVTKLHGFLEKSESWTLQERISRLRRKPSRKPNAD